MSEPNPDEGIKAGDESKPAPKAADGIAPGEPPSPASAVKKSYERYDDDPMPSLARPGTGEESGLQSLAQSARGTQLNQARWTMLIVGALTLGVNSLAYFMTMGVPPGQRPDDFTFIQMATLGFASLGIVFIILGLAVKSSPVICTTLGLGIYIVAVVVSVVLFPESVLSAASFWKIAIIVGLFNALKAARAYEAEQREAETPL